MSMCCTRSEPACNPPACCWCFRRHACVCPILPVLAAQDRRPGYSGYHFFAFTPRCSAMLIRNHVPPFSWQSVLLYVCREIGCACKCRLRALAHITSLRLFLHCTVNMKPVTTHCVAALYAIIVNMYAGLWGAIVMEGVTILGIDTQTVVSIFIAPMLTRCEHEACE